jgi:CDP-2,3-bis-(O-geranylgeranyl)-sn-glycerol synthase
MLQWLLIEAIWLILPAYAANGLVPLVRFFKTHPIDFGKKFANRPLFGATKTWEGFIAGCFIAMAIATLEMFAFPYLPFDQAPITLTIVKMSPLLGFLLGFGAMTGDLIGSFIKRRLGIPSGKPAPILDQEDFLIFSLFFASAFIQLKWQWAVLLLIITPILHYIACIIGYILKVKKEPW